MPLHAYNITGTQVALVAGNPAPILPPSLRPPDRGPVVDVTREIQGLSANEYANLEIQRPNTVVYQWSRDPEFDVGTLTVIVAIGPHQPTFHAPSHITGGGDQLSIVGTTGLNSSVFTGITSTDNGTATSAASPVSGHEFFYAPEGSGNPKGSIVETAATASPTAQPTHPGRLAITYPAGWSGGNIQISGTNAAGQAIVDTITSVPGATVGSSLAFLSIDDPDGIVNLSPAGSGIDTVNIISSNDLSVACPISGEYSNFQFHKVLANGVIDTYTASEFVRRVLPGTVLNGANHFEVWWSADFAPGQNAHNHPITDEHHTHVQANHTHDVSE